MQLPVVSISDVLKHDIFQDPFTGRTHIDLVKIDTEGYDLTLVYAILDITCPTHLIFETWGIKPEDFTKLDARLTALGYHCVGSVGDNVQYSRPSVLLIGEANWSTGSIAKDLIHLSTRDARFLDWGNRPADLDASLSEYDAVVVFCLISPTAWPELSRHGVICCGPCEMNQPWWQKLQGVQPGGCFGAVSHECYQAVLKASAGRPVYYTPATARLSRFKQHTTRKEIATLGWCGIPDSAVNFGTDGQWPYPAADTRPPICSDYIGQTAVSMRALQLYAPKTDKAAYDQAIHLAAAWMAQAQSTNNDDRELSACSASRGTARTRTPPKKPCGNCLPSSAPMAAGPISNPWKAAPTWQRLLAARGVHETLPRLVRTYFVGYAAGQVLPTRSAATRRASTRPSRRHEGAGGAAAGTVLLERALGGAATLALAASASRSRSAGTASAAPLGRGSHSSSRRSGSASSSSPRGCAARCSSYGRSCAPSHRASAARGLRGAPCLSQGRQAPRRMFRAHARGAGGARARDLVLGQGRRRRPSPRPVLVMGPLLFLVALVPFTVNGLAVRESFFVSFLGACWASAPTRRSLPASSTSSSRIVLGAAGRSRSSRWVGARLDATSGWQTTPPQSSSPTTRLPWIEQCLESVRGVENRRRPRIERRHGRIRPRALPRGGRRRGGEPRACAFGMEHRRRAHWSGRTSSSINCRRLAVTRRTRARSSRSRTPIRAPLRRPAAACNPDGSLQRPSRGYPTLWRIATEYLFRAARAEDAARSTRSTPAASPTTSRARSEWIMGAALARPPGGDRPGRPRRRRASSSSARRPTGRTASAAPAGRCGSTRGRRRDARLRRLARRPDARGERQEPDSAS